MHFAGVVDKATDEMGFIDKVAVIVDEFLEIGDALSQILFHDIFSIAWFCEWPLGPLGLNFLFFRQKESLTKKNTTQGGVPLENPPSLREKRVFCSLQGLWGELGENLLSGDVVIFMG